MRSRLDAFLGPHAVSIDGGLLLLRATTGALMMWHGLQKLPIEGGFLAQVTRMGLPAPEVMAWLAVLGEAGGGFLFAVGLLTRFAALAVIGPLLVAIFVYHAAHEFGHKELAVLYVLTSVTVMLTGPGAFSVDRWFGKRDA